MNWVRILGALSCLVLVAMCVLATIDTHLFVYPSLSRYLLSEVCITVLGVIMICATLLKCELLAFLQYESFFVLWIAYVILYGLVWETCEQYRMCYLCMSLFFVLVLANLMRLQVLKMTCVEAAFLLAAFLHIVFTIGQWLGIVESANKFFRVTGCDENPTVAALLLTGCVPMMSARIRNCSHRWLWLIFLLSTLWCIVLLRCRAAYVGLAVEACVWLVMHFRSRKHMLRHHLFYTCVAAVALLILIVTGGLKLYEMKKDSADGRLLIWKLSARMIAEKPMGYGYGMFEKNYNLRQADYFADGDYTETEKRNADFVLMPYNDFLEQGIEGGLPGLLFLLIFYVIMIRQAVRTEERESASVFCAFAVMSLFNFIYTSILPWLLLMCHAAHVACKERSMAGKHSLYCVPAVLIIPFAVISWGVVKTTDAQLTLNRLNGHVHKGRPVSDGEYASIEGRIGTSEAYWTSRAINAMKAQRFNDALFHVRQARRYSSSPALFLAEYKCQQAIGHTDAGDKSLDTLSHMIPQKFSVEQYQRKQIKQ